MKCSLCGLQFREETARSACRGCGLVRKCELVKCPNCGFEMPCEPEWLKRIKMRRQNKDANNRQS